VKQKNAGWQILDKNSDIQDLKRQGQDLTSTLKHAVGLAPHHPNA